MKIGEIVETMIGLRDKFRWGDISPTEDEALCAACNILDRLPGMMEDEAAKEVLQEFTASYKRMEAALQDAENTLDRLLGAGGQFCDDAITGYHERKKQREAGRETA